jgi:hypothetical protein
MMGHMFRLRAILLLLALTLCFFHPLSAQEAPPSELPRAFEPTVEQMQFETPTRITGRLLSLDPYDEAIWIQWTQRYEGDRWLPVSTGMQFVIYPRDAGMMEFFRALKPGAPLRMTIQKDKDGKRRVLELDGT